MPAAIVPALQVVIGASPISEAAGPAATTGTVTRLNMSTAEPLTVSLISSDTTEATVPATVVIPAGQASAQFAINAVDDSLGDGTQSLTITATATTAASFALDQGFGSGGRVTQLATSQAVAIQGDGKVVVAGWYSNTSTGRNPLDLVLTRYLADGTLDTSFAGTGRLITDISGESDRINAVAVQPDGKIVVGGTWGFGPKFDFELARFNVDGTFDATFGAGGKVVSDLSDDSYNEVWDLVLQPDGKILAAGNVGPKPTVVRYNANGSFDTTFGVGGVASTTIGQFGARGFGVALQGDGKIVVVGRTWNTSGNYDFTVLRYHPAGALDLAFDGDGIAITDSGGSEDARGVAIQADGTILVVGAGPPGAVARYRTDGGLLPAASASGASGGMNVVVGGDGRVLIVAQAGGSSIVEARLGSTDLSATANLSVTDNEAGGSIRGTLWDDRDGDGTRDQGEPILSGRTVYLDQDRDQVLDAGEISTTTSADGVYAFTGLATGTTYYVTQVLPTNWVQTTPVTAPWRAIALTNPTQQLFDFQELAGTTTREIPTYRRNGFTFDTTFQPTASFPNEFRVPGSSDTSSYAGSAALKSQWVPVTISLTRDDGAAFTLTSMRLSPVWTSIYYPTVIFTGTRANGSTVQQSFNLPNTLGFQTYTFVGFEDVKSVTWNSTSASEDSAQFDDVTVLVGGLRDFTGADFGSRDEFNVAPTAVNDAYTVAEDTTLTVAGPGILANDSDPDGDPLTAVLVTGPARGTLTLQAGGGFSYRPHANFNGTDSFTYRASDARLTSNLATVHLTVTAVNDAPVAAPDSFGVAKSGVLTVAAPGLLANDIDAEGDALTAVLQTGPTHGALTLNADGSFTYTPTAGYLGTDSFRYTAGDGRIFGANGASVTITVTGANDPPTAADDAYTIVEDGRLTGTSVLANDADPNGQTLFAMLVAAPTHGTLTLNADGTFTYRPAARYTGPDSFTYRASDGSLQSAIATVTLIVTPDNSWSQRGGDAGHTSYVDVSFNPVTLAEAWSRPLGYPQSGTGSWSERAVATDGLRVYRTELEGYAPVGTYHVIAYDLRSGAEVWHRTFIGNAFEGVGEPSVAGGVVYVNRAGHSGNSGGTNADLPRLYGLDAQTGATVLERTYAAQWGSNERPVIADGQLVVEDGYYGGISAYTASTLTRQWFVGRSAAYDKPFAALDDEFAYAFGHEVYRRSTGERLPNIAHPLGFTVADSMVSDSGRVLFEVSGNVSGAATYGVSAHDGNTHQHLWTYTTPTPPAGKAVGNGVVAVTAGRRLILLNEADGSPLRSWEAPFNLTGEIVLTRTHAFVQSVSSGLARVHAIELTTGREVWNYEHRDSSGAVMEMAMGGDHLLLSHHSFVRAFVVGSPNRAPDALDDVATTDEDTAVTIDARVNDSDPDGDTITLTAVGGAANGTVALNADGTFTYLPSANTHGTDSFTYTIRDRHGALDTATVTITVRPVADAPKAVADAYTTAEDLTLRVEAASGVLANDSDADGDPLSAVLVAPPTYGTLVLNADGSFTYTPTANYSGTDHFTYRASDGALQSAIATVTLTVTAVNDRPVSADDHYTTASGAVLTIPAPGILANDSDAEGAALTAVLVNAPAHGTLTLGPDGSFTYTPAAGYTGSDSFTYRAGDGQLAGDIATVRLTLTPATSRRYDFGTSGSPLAAGYTRVTAATAYSAAAGFGWAAGTVYDLDREWGTDTTRDANYTTDATFAVDLADGTYTVSVTMGDTAHYGHDQVGVYLQGTLADTVTTAGYEVVTRSYVVAVTGGRLTLRLRDLGGVDGFGVIMALEVIPGATTPAGTLDEADGVLYGNL